LLYAIEKSDDKNFDAA
jgi:hypothetical protein